MHVALRFALPLAAFLPSTAPAASLNPDGLGQALIYPYYTVRSAAGNAFNTYLSVVNHASDAKAVRVRVREGRAAKEVASFNLYLSPNDVWTGAVAPTTDGARILTTDRSCTDPVFTAGSGFSSLDFRSDQFTGAQTDGFGDTLDRTREGYVEVIEMATLTGASAIAVTHNSAGVPTNCAAIRTDAPLVAAPTGGLSGTLTLINVNNGQDFTVNAEALADLSRLPFFRPPSDPYPDFAASEIDPVSVVVANGQLYRSTWSRPVDAVSAVLMRHQWLGEYVLDDATASRTDVVATLPTRHHHANSTQFSPPFTAAATWSGSCGTSSFQTGERMSAAYFNRNEMGASVQCDNFGLCSPRLCAAAAVASVFSPPRPPTDTNRTWVLGSETRGLIEGGLLRVTSGFQNGWLALVPAAVGNVLTSLVNSTRTDMATGQVATGAHSYRGLPVVGFGLRTFANGTLSCGAAACQGNYGGAFPFKYRREITTQ